MAAAPRANPSGAKNVPVRISANETAAPNQMRASTGLENSRGFVGEAEPEAVVAAFARAREAFEGMRVETSWLSPEVLRMLVAACSFWENAEAWRHASFLLGVEVGAEFRVMVAPFVGIIHIRFIGSGRHVRPLSACTRKLPVPQYIIP